jgi:hypothetical protein
LLAADKSLESPAGQAAARPLGENARLDPGQK